MSPWFSDGNEPRQPQAQAGLHPPGLPSPCLLTSEPSKALKALKLNAGLLLMFIRLLLQGARLFVTSLPTQTASSSRKPWPIAPW